MTEGRIDEAFWALGAVVGALILLLPNAVIYALSYGRRITYRPSRMMVRITRVCAAVMLLGALAELLR